MRQLTNAEYKTLKSIFRLEQRSLLRVMDKFLSQTYSEDRVIARADKYLYAVGDIPVLLVAHLDTVHPFPPKDFFYDRDKNVIWSPQGLGADDRAGVYAIWRLISDGYRPHILFTTDEEIGGVGARIALEIEPSVNFIIELDRQGDKDSVYYYCDNKEFEEYINKFGFITDLGSFSDISVLCPNWEIAGVNLSIGYLDEHSRAERLCVHHMYDTIGKVERILDNVKEEDKFKYEAKKREINLGFGTFSSSGVLDEVCYECFGTFHSDMVLHGPDGGQYCGDCYSKLFTTCMKCHKEFRDKDKVHLYCETCRKEGI